MANKKIKASEKITEALPEQEKSKDNIIPFKKPRSSKEPSLVPELVITITEAKKRVTALKKFVDELMVPGVDYGVVPGADKPSLLKPGAEKIFDAFGYAMKVEVINRVEDWHRGIFHYEVRVSLVSRQTHTIECEGVGCCNSRESRYANQRGYDVANIILKVAKKRAFVDSVLTVIRGSDIFTQDIEELEWLWNKGPKASEIHPLPATKKQLSLIFSIVEQKKISVENIKSMMQERYSAAESKQLTLQQASDFIDYLKSYSYSNQEQNKELPTCNEHGDTQS